MPTTQTTTEVAYGSVTGRVCRRCDEFKPASEFRPQPHSQSTGLRSYCKPCERERQREAHLADPDARRWRVVRHRYGIDKADYEALYAEQGGVCAACRQPGEQRNGKGERYSLHIDHDHETGQIRGLLCYRCNNGIGLLGTPEALEAAAAYLRKAGH